MHSRDVPKIRRYVEKGGPQSLVDVGSFVVATIQQPFSRVAPMVEDIKLHGENSKALWGHKRAAYGHLQVYRRELYQMLVEAPVGRSEALLRATQIPGLGLVKGAFLLQCLGYETSCMDTHNIQRYGLDPKTLKVGKVKTATLEKKIEQYIELCDNIGSSEYFWNGWCEYLVGRQHNKMFTSGDEVSAYHYTAIAGE